MKKLKLLVIVAIAHVECGAASSDVWKVPYHFASKLEQELGFCRAMRVGSTLYISGSVGAGDMAAAIKQAYERIAKTLEAHGLTFHNIVKDTVFTTDLERFIAAKDIRKDYYRAIIRPRLGWR
jgi:2-iminobutanoate/2-iminopropanoate deaminase